MRVTTAFNRLLAFPGTLVEGVSFQDREVVIDVRLRSKVLVCPCGRTSSAAYDSSRRSWRHLDFGRFKVIIRAAIRRVDCRSCHRVRTEWMPFARPGARHTRDFEDMAGWLARRMSKTAVATLLRTCWQTIDDMVRRLVETHLATDRLDGLYRIGVDEIAYRGRKFLTVVTDHDTATIVWIGQGRCESLLGEFYTALGEQRRNQILTVTMDMGKIYREATRTHLPAATICFDPFHVIMWAGDALDQTHLAAPRDIPLTVTGLTPAKTWQKVRSTLRTAAENLDGTGHAIINQLRTNRNACTTPGGSKNAYATSTAPSTQTTPPTTSTPGAPPRPAATSTPSSPSPAASAATSTASPQRSTTSNPTPSPKASTPASASSNAAPTATPASTTSSK